MSIVWTVATFGLLLSALLLVAAFCVFFFLLLPLPPRSTLFPYTTLFRSGASSRTRSTPCRARAAHCNTPSAPDRKSTRLNSSHTVISYAVFCLKKKNKEDLYLLTINNVWIATDRELSRPSVEACRVGTLD